MKTAIALLLAGCLLASLPSHLAAQLPKATATRPPAASPGQPQKLLALPQAATDSAITLLWDKPTDYAAGQTYVVYRDGRPMATVPRTNATIGHLRPGTAYTFAVRAKSAAGQLGPATAEVKAKTQPAGKVENILAYGAVGDGTQLNTAAIQKAIDACAVGGTVYIPAGVFRSGVLFLKSNMTLFLAQGATLKGSANPDDYLPFIRSRFEGWELDTYASLLTAGKLASKGGFAVENLAIRGRGTVSGGGRALGKAQWDTKGERTRGRLLCLMNCRNVDIQGLTIEEPPSWTIHYTYCQNVACHDLTIRSNVRNGDGLDPDSSLDSYIFNCSFDTGDDCIAIKSGKNPEGFTIGRPTEGVYITNCNFVRGHGISIGSEMSGGVRHVLVRDCQAGALLYGMQIKGTKDRGGVVEDVRVQDCSLQRITIFTALNYNNDGQPAPTQPYFRDFSFENIDMRAGKPQDVIVLQGFSEPGHYTKNLLLRNIILPDGANVRVSQCDQVRFDQVRTVAGAKPTYEITNAGQIER